MTDPRRPPRRRTGPGDATREAAAAAPSTRSRGDARRRLAARRALGLAALAAGSCSLLLLDATPGEEELAALRSLRGGSVVSRWLLGGCVETPYVRVEDAAGTMPPVVPPSDRGRPSHVALCEEYLRRRAAGPRDSAAGGEDGAARGAVTVVEDPAVCSDWSAPHHAVMEIFASALVASAGSKLGLRYRHNCHRSVPALHSDELHYDYTSVQQLLPEQLISDEMRASVGEEQMESLCRGCVGEFQTVPPPKFGHGASSRQCLLFPGGSRDESRPPLAAALPTVADRLRRVASDHVSRTAPLEDESESGAIIFLDETSGSMNYSVYERHIPRDIKTIQIFASASCAHAAVHAGNDCIEHGRRIKRHLIRERTEKRGTYVRYDVVASTAASYARMIRARVLVCPQGTVSCLLPALVKMPGTSATVAEAQSSPNMLDWFRHVAGGLQHLNVINLSGEEQHMPDEAVVGDGGEGAAQTAPGSEEGEEDTAAAAAAAAESTAAAAAGGRSEADAGGDAATGAAALGPSPTAPTAAAAGNAPVEGAEEVGVAVAAPPGGGASHLQAVGSVEEAEASVAAPPARSEAAGGAGTGGAGGSVEEEKAHAAAQPARDGGSGGGPLEDPRGGMQFAAQEAPPMAKAGGGVVEEVEARGQPQPAAAGAGPASEERYPVEQTEGGGTRTLHGVRGLVDGLLFRSSSSSSPSSEEGRSTIPRGVAETEFVERQ